MSERELTEQQRKFLDALPGTNGNIRLAMREAGYSDSSPQIQIVRALKDEILEVTKQMLAMNAPSAAAGLVEVLHNSNTPGLQHKLTAIKEILDRVGIIKEEKLTVEAGTGLFILPAKRPKDLDEDV